MLWFLSIHSSSGFYDDASDGPFWFVGWLAAWLAGSMDMLDANGREHGGVLVAN